MAKKRGKKRKVSDSRSSQAPGGLVDEPTPPTSPPTSQPPEPNATLPAPAPPTPTTTQPTNGLLEGISRMHGVPFASIHQARLFVNLKKRTVTPSLYVDVDLLQRLGLYDDVMKLLDVLSWRKIMTGNCEVYEDLTCEFFSSLNFVEGAETGTFMFHLDGNDFEWGIEKFVDVFGLPSEEFEENIISEVEIWDMITHNTGLFVGGFSPSAHIRNPVLRYIQRLMACTVMGRSTSRNKVLKFELQMIYAMLTGQRCHRALDIIKHLMDIPGKSGSVCVGGFVTAIARHEGIDLSRRIPIGDVQKLDKTLLAQMGVLKKPKGTFMWIIEKNRELPLPNAEYTTPRGEANLKMIQPTLPETPSGVQPTRSLRVPQPAQASSSSCGVSNIEADFRKRIEQLEQGQLDLQAKVAELTKQLAAQQSVGAAASTSLHTALIR